jgi:hypothetical protein
VVSPVPERVSIESPVRPVRVVVSPPSKSLFERFGDARLDVSKSERLDAPATDWAVIPCSQSIEALAGLDARRLRVWLASARGRARLILDASGEGKALTADQIGKVHAFLAEIGAGPGDAVYVTQDRTFPQRYRSHCDARREPPRLRILNYDYWISRMFAEAAHDADGRFNHRLERFRDRKSARGRRFLSLNLTPRPTKILFLLSLLRDELWDRGFISFGGFGRLSDQSRSKSVSGLMKDTLELPGFEDLSRTLIAWLPQLRDKGQILFGRLKRREGDGHLMKDPTSDREMRQFDDSWFTVVTESEMSDAPTRITEKIFKPVMNFHPPIVLGNPGSLKLLRGYGFETFPEIFDEAYDEETRPRRRFELVYEQVVRMCALDEPELERRMLGASEGLIRNCHWGFRHLPRLFREKIDVALADQIIDPAGGGVEQMGLMVQ